MNLADVFREQAANCASLGSPFMGQLLTVLAEHWPGNSDLARVLDTYTGDIGPRGHSLPLRVGGGLHALVLSGRDAGLAAVFPPHTVSDDALCTAVLDAIEANSAFLCDWVQSPPQTNEVRRSAALIPSAYLAASHFDLPIMLSELGASGGLNLMWDRYAVEAGDVSLGTDSPVLTLTPDWSGPVPTGPRPNVVERAGVDLNPLDPRKSDDLLRMTAYLWADQPDRMQMTRTAAAVMDAPIARADAIDWLETRLAAQPEGQLHMIQHTIAWQYFPAQAQTRGRTLIEAAGTRATETRPLAWLSMEDDGYAPGKVGAALTLRLWPGDLHLNLGRVDFHGRWIKWNGVE